MPAKSVTHTEIELADRSAPLVIRVNRRAKHLILKVDPYLGEIHITAPTKRAVPEAIRFAKDREKWIAGQLDDALRARAFHDGMTAPFKGAPHVIRRSGGMRSSVRLIQTETPEIHVGGAAEHLDRRVTDWFKREARAALTAHTDQFCAMLGKPRRAIRIRDAKTRWGSCSADGVLSFTWRLIMAPPAVLEYVAAHECAHLVHLNHSPAFWRQVAALGVDARGAENWFRKNGQALFSYGAGR